MGPLVLPATIVVDGNGEAAAEIAGYLAANLVQLRPDEARAARVLNQLILTQRLG